MPIRDFQCTACDREWEAIVTSSSPAEPCPDCGSAEVKQLPPLVGGYKMRSGGGSTRPRQAGAFKAKVKTK